MGVNANISESLTGTIEAPFPEFEAPPANPMEVLRNWLERARRYGVREPRALALATVDGQGRRPGSFGEGMDVECSRRISCRSGCDQLADRPDSIPQEILGAGPGYFFMRLRA